MAKIEKHRGEFHPKGWGYELWIANSDLYCGKLLHFEKGKKCSMHYHVLKTETMYLKKGELVVHLLEPVTGEKYQRVLKPGDAILIQPGQAHQLEAVEESDLFEFSTRHWEDDSYRISKGD